MARIKTGYRAKLKRKQIRAPFAFDRDTELNCFSTFFLIISEITYRIISHPLFHDVDGANKDTIKDSWMSGIPSCNVLISFQVTPVVKVRKGVEVSFHMA